jgi:hypothetical protein
MYENRNNRPLPVRFSRNRAFLFALVATTALVQEGLCEITKESLFQDGTPQISVTTAPEPVVMPRLTDLARELSPS